MLRRFSSYSGRRPGTALESSLLQRFQEGFVRQGTVAFPGDKLGEFIENFFSWMKNCFWKGCPTECPLSASGKSFALKLLIHGASQLSPGQPPSPLLLSFPCWHRPALCPCESHLPGQAKTEHPSGISRKICSCMHLRAVLSRHPRGSPSQGCASHHEFLKVGR